ncbi:MAG TPA: Asp-tRNA(Asn)/Glu-tRNA(Gln) amidotransferase subunit GatB [Anaerolineaceae bacterium]|nr:Asp-tRNA(Asn)/Glu-tRNA(Gln) amidotransferase subunit GatB [Anaerolineaceae bacterium]HPN53481.1 Asp-tRNA(Asn)/Glu-tRNA(Gln) amidotransferase subunit GatB [Anaerolineaceae bacterium]
MTTYDEFEPVIGLEVHAEMQTQSKMFCSCPVLDATTAQANTAVCPVCAGMPGVLPVVNQRAVDYAIRVALALGCTIAPTSIFARKNYFYPDLPKGYQISQYEEPLAQHGLLPIITSEGEGVIRVRRVHLEEDTGKLTHVTGEGGSYSLVDLNRAGVPLLEIVSEPDMHTIEAVRAYAEGLRAILRYLGVNSGDMEKGVIRFEANISLRPRGSQTLGTRVEIKNLNSFRALERSVAYQIERQAETLRRGETVALETVGWNEAEGVTFIQRSKEEAHDYRYFPEPDLPPLVVDEAWVEKARALLPELPQAILRRFQQQYQLSAYDAGLLTAERDLAVYFEAVLAAAPGVSPKQAANWVLGDLFALMNSLGRDISSPPLSPDALAGLLQALSAGQINNSTAKTVLTEMAASGKSARQIIDERGLTQISDASFVSDLVQRVLAENAGEVERYRAGKESLGQWFFGQVMRQAQGKANPQVVREELQRQLDTLK